MGNRPAEFTIDDYRKLAERKNWGRWGADDQRGALNLITDKVRVKAARLVQSGRVVSLGRVFATEPAENNARPAVHYMNPNNHRGDGRAATDFLAIDFHQYVTTHIDALGHTWDSAGMWDGRDPAEAVSFSGVAWGGAEHLAEGIVTRGVLIDVPRHRGGEPVTVDAPLHGYELEEICREQGVEMQPGDALVVYSGRGLWEATYGPWGNWGTVEDGQRFASPVGRRQRPGMHESCLEFIRDHDCAVLAWDMTEAFPSALGVPFPVHAAIHWFGVVVLDYPQLEELSQVAQELERYEFMFTVAPLRIIGGTGCPVNPLAVF